jgi:hypothetical protein
VDALGLAVTFEFCADSCGESEVDALGLVVPFEFCADSCGESEVDALGLVALFEICADSCGEIKGEPRPTLASGLFFALKGISRCRSSESGSSDEVSDSVEDGGAGVRDGGATLA